MTEKLPNNSTHFTILGAQNQPNTMAAEQGLTAEAWISSAKDAIGAYLHVPFCFHKCHYCDFFSVAGKEDQHTHFVDRLVKELATVGPHLSQLQTIFIGGGTPTLLEPNLLRTMLEAVQRYLPVGNEIEFTIEANPETVTAEKADIMASCGVNRVSIGAQSFDPALLKVLERWHDPVNVERAVSFVKDAGISNVSMDLIYAIPSQSISLLQSDLQNVIALDPMHVSCYALTYEPNTPMLQRLKTGKVMRVDHELEADMFDLVTTELASHSYAQYEISNYAKDGFTCKHNLMYWKNKNWWPFGPAGAGHVAGRRWRNNPRLSDYLLDAALPPVQDVELLSEDIQAGEAFMMGLRLLEGMERIWVESLLQMSPNNWRNPVLHTNINNGMLEWKKDMLLLTDKGLHFADTVISELLMHDENEPRIP